MLYLLCDHCSEAFLSWNLLVSCQNYNPNRPQLLIWIFLYLKKLVFFRLELELTEILRGSNFRFLVAGKRFASARALASLGFARLSQIDFTLLTFYKLKKNKKLIITRHVYCKSGNFCLTIFVQQIYPINMRAIYFKLH